MSTEVIVDEPKPAATKQRETLFDVAKGLAILVVLGHHCSSYVARLYTDLPPDLYKAHHSILWWSLNVLNRVLSFSVPAFLLISAVLSARSLNTKPAVIPFYKRRFPGILWPYAVWTAIYWIAHMATSPDSLKPRIVKVFGYELTGPAFLTHAHDRWLDLFWGKAYFHMYFMVVLLGLILLLPPAVAYVKWRKPSFAEIMVTAFVVQGAIMVVQHYSRLMPYPGSNVLWYIGSLLPGAWIGVNWERFKEESRRYIWPLAVVCVITLGGFLYEEVQVWNHIEAGNYESNGSLTIYASCLSILFLMLAGALSQRDKWRKVLEPLGQHSLQIYLIHPGVMMVMERAPIVAALRATHLGVILAPLLMFAVTIGLIALFRLVRLEKPLFGRGA